MLMWKNGVTAREEILALIKESNPILADITLADITFISSTFNSSKSTATTKLSIAGYLGTVDVTYATKSIEDNYFGSIYPIAIKPTLPNNKITQRELFIEFCKNIGIVADGSNLVDPDVEFELTDNVVNFRPKFNTSAPVIEFNPRLSAYFSVYLAKENDLSVLVPPGGTAEPYFNMASSGSDFIKFTPNVRSGGFAENTSFTYTARKYAAGTVLGSAYAIDWSLSVSPEVLAEVQAAIAGGADTTLPKMTMELNSQLSELALPVFPADIKFINSTVTIIDDQSPWWNGLDSDLFSNGILMGGDHLAFPLIADAEGTISYERTPGFAAARSFKDGIPIDDRITETRAGNVVVIPVRRA